MDLIGVKDQTDKLDRTERLLTQVEPGTKIVQNYIRPSDTSEPTQRCPKCGRDINQSEWQEHMRIELLDPKWREEKEEYLSAQRGKEVTDAELTKNMNRMKANGPDIYGEQATEGQKSTGPKVIWDGQSDAITRSTAKYAMLQGKAPASVRAEIEKAKMPTFRPEEAK